MVELIPQISVVGATAESNSQNVGNSGCGDADIQYELNPVELTTNSFGVKEHRENVTAEGAIADKKNPLTKSPVTVSRPGVNEVIPPKQEDTAAQSTSVALNPKTFPRKQTSC
jgi:hypothetical protein